MSDIPFHATYMGRKFYEADVPRIAKALERIADGLTEVINMEKTEATNLRAGVEKIAGELEEEAMGGDWPGNIARELRELLGTKP